MLVVFASKLCHFAADPVDFRLCDRCERIAVRHSGAHRVRVTLAREPGLATLDVDDDGRGFDVRRAEERRPGMGLFSMRERVALVNGTLTVTSTEGRGTRVHATVPVST